MREAPFDSSQTIVSRSSATPVLVGFSGSTAPHASATHETLMVRERMHSAHCGLAPSPRWGEGWGGGGAFEPHAVSPPSGIGLQTDEHCK